SQGARTQALADFKMGKVQVLVATDIAARGLDIEQLPHVVNFELPNIAEDYVHRIGRTGRAGREGQAISLVCGEEMKQLKDIERLINRKIPQLIVAGYASTESTKVDAREPAKQGQKRRRHRRGNSSQRPAARAK
ncbi:MAG: helicase-related protein, partial [Gammaproteobacteria bacterium]|nr:helicase-related protein [Gammaproteobacteria bacterium]